VFSNRRRGEGRQALMMRPTARLIEEKKNPDRCYSGTTSTSGKPPGLLPPRHRLPLDKEHPRQPAFAERLGEHAEGEIRNEHQQHDEVAGECFLQPGAKKLAKRSSDRPVVEQADDGFLDDSQDYQQHQAAVSNAPIDPNEYNAATGWARTTLPRDACTALQLTLASTTRRVASTPPSLTESIA
jgi:hypothetical protein